MALHGVDRHSEAESVAFLWAQRDKSKPRKSNTVAAELADAWINLAFSVRLAERYEQAEAKDDERPNNSGAHRTCTLILPSPRIFEKLAPAATSFALPAGPLRCPDPRLSWWKLSPRMNASW